MSDSALQRDLFGRAAAGDHDAFATPWNPIAVRTPPSATHAVGVGP